MARKKSATKMSTRSKAKEPPPPSSPSSPPISVSDETIRIVNSRILKEQSIRPPAEPSSKASQPESGIPGIITLAPSDVTDEVSPPVALDETVVVRDCSSKTSHSALNANVRIEEVLNQADGLKQHETLQDKPTQATPPLNPKPRASYSEALAGNMLVSSGRKLNFVDGIVDGVIHFTKADVQKNTSQWKRSLIGMVVGVDISYNIMLNFVLNGWNDIKPPKIIRNDNGVFVFKFEDEKDIQWVMERGPWLIGGNKPLVLKRWTEGVKLDATSFESTQVWVNLPDLDVRFWSEEFFEKIGSAIGKPVFIDKVTANQERLSFARILVEVSAKSELRNDVKFLGEDGEIINQAILYEWIPAKCETCLAINLMEVLLLLDFCGAIGDLSARGQQEITRNSQLVQGRRGILQLLRHHEPIQQGPPKALIDRNGSKLGLELYAMQKKQP